MKKYFLAFWIFNLLTPIAYAELLPPNTIIEYNLISLGGDRYRYDYTIINAPSNNTTAIQLFDITFSSALYDENSLVITTANPLASQWEEVFLSSVTGDDPIYDAFSVAGILDGQRVGEFSVEFTWLGTGTPSSQPFDVYDPDLLILLETGTTQLKQAMVNPPTSVAASAVPTLSHISILVLMLVLLLIAGFYWKETDQKFYMRLK